MSESVEAMDYVSSSVVEAEYELFNKELGLDTTNNKDNTIEAQEKTEIPPVSVEDSAIQQSAADEGTAKEEEGKEEEKEEETEEPDSDDDVVEDAIDEWDGEDPSEAEVAQFCQPPEQLILSDLAEQPKKRRVALYPVKLGELGHPSIIEVMKTCLEYKTSFAQSKLNAADENEGFSFYGVVEFVFKSCLAALEAVETLKSVREDVTVRIMDPAETAKKVMQNWTVASVTSASTLENLAIVRPLSKDATIEQLRDLFPDTADIVIAQPKGFARLAYLFYDESSLADEVVDKYKVEKPVIGDCRSMVLKYQPPKLPPGFLKMDRRYRILLQIKKLEKALKNKKAHYFDSQRKKMQSTVEHCTLLIEKDDSSRKQLGLKTMTLKELHRIRKIREAVKPETIWLPRLPGDKREDAGRIDLGEDDSRDHSRERKNDTKRTKRFDQHSNQPSLSHQGRWSSSSGVPSLLSIEMEGPAPRVKAGTNQIAALTSLMPFGFGGMRGGMMRGRGGFRGQFGRGGGGGYMDEDMGQDFGPPGGPPFGPRRIGKHGGFNKRPRQDSERGFRETGRDVGGEGKSFPEPVGKMAKPEVPQSWPSGHPERMPSLPANRGGGKQGGWSKPSSNLNPGGPGGSTSGPAMGFRPPNFFQGGMQRGGGHGPGFNQGSYNEGGGGGGGFNQGGSGGYGPNSGGFSQGTGGGFNQDGSSGYGPANVGGFNQMNLNEGGNMGYNQGGTNSYNAASGGYNPNTPAYNQSNCYNQPQTGYNQSSGSYDNQNTSYGYNYSTQSTSSGTGFPAAPAPVPPSTPQQPQPPQQPWTVPNAPGQNYWQQSAQGTWQPQATTTGQVGQSSDQSAYNYGWNTWK